MKKNITAYMPKAIEAVEKLFTTKSNNQNEEKPSKVYKEYKGYVASFGAALRTSGLIPTLAFYTDINRKDSDANRYKVLQAMAYCLDSSLTEKYGNSSKCGLCGAGSQQGENEKLPCLLCIVKKDVYGENGKQKQDSLQEKIWTKRLIEISIALKLAMRNFEYTEE